MLTINNVTKSYGVEPVLRNISFTVNQREIIGLIGPNGCGKTTLLRIIAGCEEPDSGSVQFTPSVIRVGYLAQGVDLVGEETIESYLGISAQDTTALADRLENLAAQLSISPHNFHLQNEYDEVLTRMQSIQEGEDRRANILASMGLGEFSGNTPCRILSGGQKTRLALASVLISNPHLLLLDEPTNHLDIAMLEWMEEWLKGFPGGILVVSHDRTFLDRLCTGVVELSPVSHNSRFYAGNYSAYLLQKDMEIEKAQHEYADQQEEIASLRAAAAHLRGLAKFRKGGKADGGDKFARGFFANRGSGTVGRAKHLEARLEKLLDEEKVVKPRSSWKMRIEFEDLPESGKIVLELKELSVGYGRRILLQDMNLSIYNGWRVAFTGENGCGKTTLLRTIAGQIPPIGGRIRLGSSIRLGYMAQEQEDLDPSLTVLQTAAQYRSQSETEVRAYLHKYLFSGDDVFLPVGNLSFGERARLSLACLVAQGCNFLLLDEPINHLDIPSREQFEKSLQQYEGSVLAVVHDRYFISRFATHIWDVRQGTVQAMPY